MRNFLCGQVKFHMWNFFLFGDFIAEFFEQAGGFGIAYPVARIIA
jgi:hypothetical protein